VLERHGVSLAMYSAAILAGILVLPRLAAVAYLVVAARAVLLPTGDGRLTLRWPG